MGCVKHPPGPLFVTNHITQGETMSQDLLVELRARRAQVQDEMRVRLDEIDRLIARISESDLPLNRQSVQATSKIVTGNSRRRRQSTTTAGDIIERANPGSYDESWIADGQGNYIHPSGTSDGSSC